jgi:hypothetical protein
MGKRFTERRCFLGRQRIVLVVAHRTALGARADFPASIYRFPAADELKESLAGGGFSGCRTVTLGFGEVTVSFHVAGR